jgi:hypothetical protein
VWPGGALATWVPDETVIIRFMHWSTHGVSSLAISKSPELTATYIANLIGPVIVNDLIAWIPFDTTVAAGVLNYGIIPAVDVTVEKGESVFFSPIGLCEVAVYFDKIQLNS